MADATPPPQIIFDVTATATTATRTLHERHNVSNALKLLRSITTRRFTTRLGLQKLNESHKHSSGPSRPAEAFPPATGHNVRNSLTHFPSPLRPAEDFFPGDSSSGAVRAHRGRKSGQASSSCINPSQHSPAAAALSSSLQARLQQRASPRAPSTPTAGSSTRPPGASSPARGTSAKKSVERSCLCRGWLLGLGFLDTYKEHSRFMRLYL
jgi:hypothetical protein